MPTLARVKWAKFRVTAVAVVGVLILVTLLYELFGGALFAPKTTLYLYIPDASGLSNESPIRVDGITVGRVSDVALSGLKDPNRAVKVTLMFYRDRLSGVPVDSVTQISSDSLVGDKFVDINGGKSPRDIPPGGEITYKYQPELLRSLDLTQFTNQLRIVDATLTDLEQGRSPFGKFFKGTEFYNDLQRRMDELQRGIHAAVSSTGAVGALVGSDKLYAQTSDLVTQIDRQIAQIQAGQGTAGQMLRSSAPYDQLLKTSQELHKTLDTIGQNQLLQSPELYDSLDQSLTAVIQKVDDFNRTPLMATTATYEQLNGSMKELRDHLRDFRTNPKKYLRMKLF